MKKLLVLLVALSLLITVLAGCGGGADAGNATGGEVVTVAPVTAAADTYADGDYKDVTGETPNAEITLSGSTGTLSDTTRGASGSTVTITSKGIYRVTGSSENVQITVNDSTKSGNVYLVLEDVAMTNAGAPCILVEDADKVILQVVGDCALTASDSEAVKAKDDLTVNGSGSLTVTGDDDGISCNNDLRITGAALTVNAGKIGLSAGDSVSIGGGTVTVTAGHDGVQLRNDTGDSVFNLTDGTLTISAGYDGIDVGTDAATFTGSLNLTGGKATVTAGGGSANGKTETSQKGLKCDGAVNIGDVALTVDAADDAISAGADVNITAGVSTLSSSDDGIHADATLNVAGGTLTVAKAYEGLEAETVNLTGGSVSVTSSDDGVNAAGGSDSTSTEAGPWGGSATGTLNVTGGTVYVNAGGDGLDSNGSLYVTGGTVIVEGPTDSGNGALDAGDGPDCVCSVTGGTVLALGSSGMAVNFNAGSQPSALVAVSVSAGDVITVDDGSGFTFTATKSFSTAVYSSPSLQQGKTYTLTVGNTDVTLDFSSGLYYSTAQTMGGNKGGRGF